MRILFWNELFVPSIGGVEIFTLRLGKRLLARGHAVAVVAARHRPELPQLERIEGIEVHRLPFWDALGVTARDPASVRRVAAAVDECTTRAAEIKRRFRPDVVHVNLAGANSHFHLRTLRAHPSATTVAFMTAIDRQAAGTRLLKQLIGEAARLVALSTPAAANVAEMMDVSLDRIAIIAPGIAAEEFDLAASRDGSGVPAFAFIGRLVDDKGADVAVEAAVRAQSRHDLKLRLMGDGPQRPHLERQIAAHGAGHFIALLGQASDAERRALLADSFALLVPSRHLELFGMVAVEGALAGLPVIASRRGGLAEIVRDRETGLLVEPDDPDAWAQAMLSLAADPSWAARMGQAGRARAIAEYGLERTVDRYEAHLAAAAETFAAGAAAGQGRSA